MAWANGWSGLQASSRRTRMRHVAGPLPRSSSAGCSAERRPTSFEARLQHAARRFNWGELLRYDDAWVAAMQARAITATATADPTMATTPPPRPARVLNVSLLTSLRGDGHCEDCASSSLDRVRPPGPADRGGAVTQAEAAAADCLHYCLPGPVDTWSVLLQEML